MRGPTRFASGTHGGFSKRAFFLIYNRKVAQQNDVHIQQWCAKAKKTEGMIKIDTSELWRGNDETNTALIVLQW